MPTLVLLTVFLTLLVLTWTLWATFLRLGLTWARVGVVTTPRIVLATAVVLVAHVFLTIAFRIASHTTAAATILLGFLELAAAVGIPCFVVARLSKPRFCAHFKRGFQRSSPRSP